MPVTPAYQIYSPSDSDQWDLVVDLSAMAVTIDTALAKVAKGANTFRGTSAEMSAALATSPRGTYWFSTTNNTTYRRGVTEWVIWDEPTATNVSVPATVTLHATYPMQTRIIGGIVHLTGMVQAVTGTLPLHSSMASFAAPYTNPRQRQEAMIWDPLAACTLGAVRIFGTVLQPKSGTLAAIAEVSATWPISADI